MDARQYREMERKTQGGERNEDGMERWTEWSREKRGSMDKGSERKRERERERDEKRGRGGEEEQHRNKGKAGPENRQ